VIGPGLRVCQATYRLPSLAKLTELTASRRTDRVDAALAELVVAAAITTSNATAAASTATDRRRSLPQTRIPVEHIAPPIVSIRQDGGNRDICVTRKCYVAAGDFLDTELRDAYDRYYQGKETRVYKWLHEYLRGMKHPQTAAAWAWHAYSDGADTTTKYHNGSPHEWWKRFLKFRERVRVVSKNGPNHHADIWLTEQGVVYSQKGIPTPAGESEGIADDIMNAYVNHHKEGAPGVIIGESSLVDGLGLRV
jgi:hypothetical protein